MRGTMFGILRGNNGRRHEVDFGDDAVVVDVAMSDMTVQITVTASGDLPPDRARFITVTLPRDQLAAAMAAATRQKAVHDGTAIRSIPGCP